jgi:hypothetical protein
MELTNGLLPLLVQTLTPMVVFSTTLILASEQAALTPLGDAPALFAKSLDLALSFLRIYK